MERQQQRINLSDFFLLGKKRKKGNRSDEVQLETNTGEGDAGRASTALLQTSSLINLMSGQKRSSRNCTEVHPEENTRFHDPLNPNMLQCTNRTIEGKAGDTVILPCLQTNKMDLSLEEVEWSTKDPTTGKKIVHVYFQGEDYLHQQRDDFKDRTSLFKEELSSGNCSLRLLATTSHSGRYQCHVGGHLFSTVTLKVLPEGTNNTSQMHQNVTESPVKPLNGTDGLTKIQQDKGVVVAGAVIGVVGGVLGVAALIIIIALAYYYREQLKNFCTPKKPRKRQIFQDIPLQAQQPPENQEKKPANPNPNEERIQMIENEDQDDPADGN